MIAQGFRKEKHIHKSLILVLRILWGADRVAFIFDGKQRGPSNSACKYKKYHHNCDCCGYDKRYKEGGISKERRNNGSSCASRKGCAVHIFQIYS